MTDPVRNVLSRLKGVKQHANGVPKWEAKCPAHEDRKPSLGVSVGNDGKVLLYCQAGCSFDSVVKAMGLEPSDLFLDNGKSSGKPIMNGKPLGNGKRRFVCSYDYRDEAGVLLYRSVRMEPKHFYQRRPDGKGGWINNLGDCQLVLYRLPELLAAALEELTFIVEGEKDVDALRALGLVATCNPMGAEKWKPVYNEALRDRHVVLIPDNDDAGCRHVAQVRKHLHGVAASITTVPLYNVPDKGDVSDWLAAGGDKESLLELVDEAKKNPEPEGKPDEEDATVADLIAAGATTKWAWPGWLSIGELNVLASEPGVGKTRFCADLARRIYHGLPWPDGTPATFPAGAKTLWIAADCQHAELTRLSQEFGIPPEAMLLNAPKSNPFGGTMLDEEEDVKDLERRIERTKPALVFVDTTLKATDRTAHKPEDVKAFFTPLQQVIQRQMRCMLGVTHLNAEGKPLGRRIEGVGRVVMMLERPDPDGQPDRRKLYVKKSHSLYPSPLGVTMGGQSNDYDTSPPVAPASEPAFKSAKKGRSEEMKTWLGEKLAGGPRRVNELRAEAENGGFSTATLYQVKNGMPISEYMSEGYKVWELTLKLRGEDEGAV
jgi:hypothetical protein